eukprot:gene28510-35378_t
MHRIALLVGVVCFLIVIYFVYISRAVQRKWKSTANKYGSVAGNSSGDDSYSNSSSSIPTINFTGEVPMNFVTFFNGNKEAAQAAYSKRLQWRLDERIDEIMETPQPGFDNMLKYYPHAIHGYSLDGCAVVYELLGQASTDKLLNSGVTIADLVRHMVLRNELVFERLTEPAYLADVMAKYPEAFDRELMHANNPHKTHRLMSILDLKGVSLASFNTTVITFIAQSGAVVDSYFPQQVARLVMCNAPSWLYYSWAGISVALPSHVKNKIVIQSGVEDLGKFIHHSQRSKTYGGSDPLDVGQAPGHKAFLQLAENWNSGKSNGVTKREAPAVSTSSSISSTGVVSASKSKANNKEIESYSAVGDQVASVHRPPATSSPKKSGGGGLMGWWSGRGTATEAHMGGRLDYKYDVKSGGWKQGFDEEDGDEEEIVFETTQSILPNQSIDLSHSQDSHDNHRDHKNGKKNKGKKSIPSRHSPPTVPAETMLERLEDHAALVALNIAQTHALDLESGHQRTALTPKRQSSKDLSKLSKSASFSLSSGPHHGSSGVEMTEEEQRASWGLFVLVGGMHVVSVLVQGSLFALLPVYLMGVVSTQGLSYSIHDLALVLSTTALCVLHWQMFFSLRLEYCLKASPVRTLRIGCGILIVLCFLLPMYLHISTYNTNSAAAMLTATSTPQPFIVNNNIRGGVIYDAAVIAPLDSHIKVPRDSRHHFVHAALSGGSTVNYNPPSRSVITLILTSFLVSALVVASHVCRKASNILFHLTLNSTFSSSTSLRCIINHLLDIAAPLIACYWLRARHNSAFFLSLAIFVVLPVYIASIFLGVQFRGDYGVMTDSQGGAAALVGGGGAGSGKGHGGLVMHSVHSSNTAVVQGQDVFNLPFGDLSLLFSQIGYSYGSKLYNLRDDFKDL